MASTSFIVGKRSNTGLKSSIKQKNGHWIHEINQIKPVVCESISPK